MPPQSGQSRCRKPGNCQCDGFCSEVPAGLAASTPMSPLLSSAETSGIVIGPGSQTLKQTLLEVPSPSGRLSQEAVLLPPSGPGRLRAFLHGCLGRERSRSNDLGFCGGYRELYRATVCFPARSQHLLPATSRSDEGWKVIIILAYATERQGSLLPEEEAESGQLII